MEHRVAQRMSRLHTESAFQILEKAQALEAQGKSIVHMEIGQPDFKTPKHIIEAGYNAMLDGFTCYTPTAGYPHVREAIAQYTTEHKGVPTDWREVVMMAGGKPVIFFTMAMLVEPGDEVICPNPGFPIYESCIRYAGGVPVPMEVSGAADFRVTGATVEKLITPKTKLIILNSPSNPTGGVIGKEDMDSIVAVLEKHPNVYILSDEIYERLSFGGKPVSIASYPQMKERTIILDGFSKTYAMTGWRLGYGIMPRELVDKMELLVVNSTSCAAAFSQYAGVAALQGSQDEVETMRQSFQQRRDWLVGALNQIDGVHCCMPGGAFYAFPDISSFGLSSTQFCDGLMEAGVAAAAGSSFGQYGEGYMRLSYATSMDNIKRAVDTIARYTKSL